MFRTFLIVLLFTGCATTTDKPLLNKDKNSLGNIGVISTIGDDLLCTYMGLTIFTNEKQSYKIPKEFNGLLTSEITKELSNLNLVATPLKREYISFLKEDKGASKFSNIKFNKVDFPLTSIDTLIIFDGSFHYKSTGGYYARDNALNTSANLYVYNLSSGELIAKSSKFSSDLKRKFSCELDSFPPKSDMSKLVNNSALEMQKELVGNLFLINK